MKRGENGFDVILIDNLHDSGLYRIRSNLDSQGVTACVSLSQRYAETDINIIFLDFRQAKLYKNLAELVSGELERIPVRIHRYLGARKKIFRGRELDCLLHQVRRKSYRRIARFSLFHLIPIKREDQSGRFVCSKDYVRVARAYLRRSLRVFHYKLFSVLFTGTEYCRYG